MGNGNVFNISIFDRLNCDTIQVTIVTIIISCYDVVLYLMKKNKKNNDNLVLVRIQVLL